MWRVSFLLLAACASVSPVHSARPRTTPSCTLRDDLVTCGAAQLDLRELGLTLPVRSSAPRVLGGLFVLDGAGVLLRIDRQARPTGHEPGNFVALRALKQQVCTLDDAGQLACFVDRHDERGCGANDALPDMVIVANRFGTRLMGDETLCDEHGRCVQLKRPCERACLRFPSCHAPLRCVDVCAEGQAPLRAHPRAQLFGGPFIIDASCGDSRVWTVEHGCRAARRRRGRLRCSTCRAVITTRRRSWTS